jgi:hypothetical protein
VSGAELAQDAAIGARIDKIISFRNKLNEYRRDRSDAARTYLNEHVRAVRREVVEAGCHQTITISPPPAVGGLMIKNADPFDMMFQHYYGLDINQHVVDMLDQTIGELKARSPESEKQVATVAANPVQKGYVFVAMPMAGERPEYDDVLDAIKAAADACGLVAERVDEVQSNERITDRLLESIRRAEFVIADLTDARPNVFYEAGYAYGLGKTPIYVAREGTKLEFDLRDYPVIFFSSMRQLRVGLEKRLRAINR